MRGNKDNKKSVSEDENKPERYQKIDRRMGKQKDAKTGPAGEVDDSKLDPPHQSENKRGHRYL